MYIKYKINFLPCQIDVCLMFDDPVCYSLHYYDLHDYGNIIIPITDIIDIIFKFDQKSYYCGKYCTINNK